MEVFPQAPDASAAARRQAQEAHGQLIARQYMRRGASFTETLVRGIVFQACERYSWGMNARCRCHSHVKPSEDRSVSV